MINKVGSSSSVLNLWNYQVVEAYYREAEELDDSPARVIQSLPATKRARLRGGKRELAELYLCCRRLPGWDNATGLQYCCRRPEISGLCKENTEMQLKRRITLTTWTNVLIMAHLRRLCSSDASHKAGSSWSSVPRKGFIWAPSSSISKDITFRTFIWIVQRTTR